MRSNQMKKVRTSTKFWLVIGGFVVLAAATLYFKLQMQKATVAMVGDTVTTSSCVSNISTFTTTGSCGNNMVKNVAYTCTEPGKAGTEGNGTCIDPVTVYERAKLYCGQTCAVTGTAVPRPSLASSPMPSATPTSSSGSPLFTCNVRVFKLKSTDLNQSPLLFATTDREVSGGLPITSPGDRFAYLIEAKSSFTTTIATISASTVNNHGFDEPILIKSVSNFCKIGDDKGKYLSCVYPQTSFSAGVAKTLELGMVVEIQDSIKTILDTNVRFHVNYLYSGSYYPADCNVIMYYKSPSPMPSSTPLSSAVSSPIAVSSSAPIASGGQVSTPTPYPTAQPGCTMEKRFCAQSLLGRACPPVEICPPQPSLKPTPAPTVRACAMEMGSCMTKANTCLTYTDSCAKEDFCATPFKLCKPTVTKSPLPVGCRLEQVKCVKAPCEPVMTCATPTPTPSPIAVTPRLEACYRFFGRYFCFPTFRR